MAIQVLDPGLSTGALLGQGLGVGLSQGLQQLAESKMQQVAQRQMMSQTSNTLQALGLPKADSDFVASLPQNQQAQVVSSFLQSRQPSTTQQNALQGMLTQQPEMQTLPEKYGVTYTDAQGLVQPTKKGGSVPLSANPKFAQPVSPTQPRTAMGSPLSGGFGSASASGQFNLADALIPPAERREREKLEIARRKEKRQEEEQQYKKKLDAYKLTKEDRKDIVQGAKAARDQIHDLDRMEELDKSGKLDTPGYVEFLKRSGLDIPALMNPESEEFNKIANNFVRDAKNYFGGRVSNYEVEQFLKTIPSLSQSPEGRKRVIANLKYLNRVKLEYLDAMKDVIKENDGLPPLDLNEAIEGKISKRLDSISQKFKKDLSRPVPQGQNRLITGLQAAGGSILGAPGSLVGKVGSLLSAI